MAQIYTNTVRASIVSALNGTAIGPFKYLGWGTGAGTSSAADTTLFTETTTANDPGYARAATTNTVVTTTVTNDTLQMVGTLTAGAALTITNCGVFDATANGNLFVKADFTGLALNSGDNIQATFKYQQQ